MSRSTVTTTCEAQPIKICIYFAMWQNDVGVQVFADLGQPDSSDPGSSSCMNLLKSSSSPYSVYMSVLSQ